MEVADELQEVRLFLADRGFVAVLKQVAVAPVPTVEIPRVPREETPETPGKGVHSCPDEKVKVVRHERPGIDDEGASPGQGPKPLHEPVTIAVVPEYLPALDPPAP